ncbi:hypothetical protein [Aeromonas simiae]|uniref:hypothetical protein n=1 Tax=Aeromonas simiae TaxID=218936 RepID=UPI00266D98F0|nr:hypothetical protein [Aeromonas simiae]MDO2949326.1 hypothetical protein [Aeromonas simiae]MDO2952790.1 hypothetical protein [Aeromonas simiae]MDO2956551.1 hypothetical protein [Aeromonas simiae]
MNRFEIWSQRGQSWVYDVVALRRQVLALEGEVMVRYVNRLGAPCSLFLVIEGQTARQRFKPGMPPLDWEWLRQALHEPALPLSLAPRNPYPRQP